MKEANKQAKIYVGKSSNRTSFCSQTMYECFYRLVVWARITTFCILSGFVQVNPKNSEPKRTTKNIARFFVHDLFINYVAINVDLDTAERFAWKVARVDTRRWLSVFSSRGTFVTMNSTSVRTPVEVKTTVRIFKQAIFIPREALENT